MHQQLTAMDRLLRTLQNFHFMMQLLVNYHPCLSVSQWQPTTQSAGVSWTISVTVRLIEHPNSERNLNGWPMLLPPIAPRTFCLWSLISSSRKQRIGYHTCKDLHIMKCGRYWSLISRQLYFLAWKGNRWVHIHSHKTTGKPIADFSCITVVMLYLFIMCFVMCLVCMSLSDNV